MRTRGRKEKKTARKDTYAITVILTYVFCLIFRIPLLYLIGERGISYFGMANELYLFFGCLLATGLSEASASLIRYRMRREQYAGARRVLKGSLLTGAVLGGAFSILFLAAGQLYAEKIIRMPLAGLCINMMAPALVFQTLTGVIKGYFQGNGSKVPAMHSKILETVFLFGGGYLGTVLLQDYGKRVSALLQNEDYAAAYGAFGASIGILSAAVLCFLHMLFLLLIFLRNGKKQAGRDMISKDKGFHIVHMLLGTAAPYSLYAVLFQCLPFFDGIFFQQFSKEANDSITLWGNYYGKYMVITGIIFSLLSLTVLEPVRKIGALTDREEYRSAKEALGNLIHQGTLLSFPAAIFTAVLSENILDVLWKGNNTVTAQWLMQGSVLLVLQFFSMLFSGLLLRLRKMKYVIRYGSIAFAVHIVAVILLLKNTLLGITAVILGNILFYFITAVLGFLLVVRSLQYRQEWVRSFAVTAITSAIAGLIVMLLNKAVAPATGKELSLLICLPIGILIYLILLIVARGVKEEELRDMWGGSVLIGLGKLLHFM